MLVLRILGCADHAARLVGSVNLCPARKSSLPYCMSRSWFGVGSVDVPGVDGSGRAPAKSALVARVVRMSLSASVSLIVWMLDIYATRRFMVHQLESRPARVPADPTAVDGHVQDAELRERVEYSSSAWAFLRCLAS
jgi:hypothetical protein